MPVGRGRNEGVKLFNMPLIINLPAEMETAILEQAKAVGLEITAYAARVLEEHLQKEPVGSSHFVAGGFRESLQQIIAIHPNSQHRIHDSRDSIYSESDQ